MSRKVENTIEQCEGWRLFEQFKEPLFEECEFVATFKFNKLFMGTFLAV